MKFDIGLIIAVGAALLFYFRLISLQRQRVRRYKSMQEAQNTPVKGKNKGKSPEQAPLEKQLGFRISNWYILGAGMFIILLGAFISGSSIFPEVIRPYWWVAVVAGIFMLNYTIH